MRIMAWCLVDQAFAAISTEVRTMAVAFILPLRVCRQYRRPFLDGELEVLHFLVVRLQAIAQVHQLFVRSCRHLVGHLMHRFWGTDAGHHVLALGIDQVLAEHGVFAGAGLRVNPTPVAESEPMLPNTMVTTLTAVPLAMSGVIWNSRR